MSRSESLGPSWRRNALISYVVFMLLLFLLPVPGSAPEGTTHLDKIVHFSVFLGFAVLFHLDGATTAAPTLVASVGFAAAIEALQWLLPYREGDWYDLAAGALGGGVGAAIVLWSARHRRAVT